MNRSWIVGHHARLRARAEAQHLADLASRPVLMWQADRQPPTFIVDLVPETWAAFSAGWLVLPRSPRLTYRAQVKQLLGAVRASLSRRDKADRPVGEEPTATLQVLEAELTRLLADLPKPKGARDEAVASSDPDVCPDELGLLRVPCPEDEPQGP